MARPSSFTRRRTTSARILRAIPATALPAESLPADSGPEAGPDALRDRFAFLAEVSRCLAASLDYESTLTTVAGMSLPYLHAWCIVDIVTDETQGTIRRLAVLHPD